MTSILTPEDVGDRVAEIERAKGDPEHAHKLEDALYRDVLQAIADGVAEDPRLCAFVALETKALAFPRWVS